MNNINLNIIANAQFQQVYAEVAKLKEAMLSLQKTAVGGPFTTANVSSIKQAQQAFDNAVLSTRAFNIESVAMSSNVEKFGKSLAGGKLGINQYYSLWRDNLKGTSKELDALATQQARLNRSIAIADPLRPGYAKLVTDINGVVTSEEKAVFYQQALNTAIQQGATKLIDFGKNMQWAGRQMTVGLTVPLTMFATGAANAFLNFDKQMTSMLKVYGAHAVVQSQQTLDTIRKEVTQLATDLAHTLGIAMSDTVEIAKTFSSVGLEGKDLIKTTQATATLMKLGDLQATNAAQSMVALQNVFKLQSNQMQDAVNFLNAAKHSTSTTMQDIIDAIPRVGPILQQMGGTYRDFVTLLVGMRESGIPAAQAANAIKSMFASIENPTTKAVKLFDSLGISLKGIVANDANNPLKMVQDLQVALDKLPSLTRQQAIENLFGKFQFARVEALLNNLGKTGSQTQKVLELYGQSSDQLAAVAKQELDVASNKTPAAQFAKMKASLQADLIPLGQTFLQAFTKLGNIVDKIVKGFNGLGIVGKAFLAGFAVVGILGPIIMLVGLFSNLAGQIIKGVNYMNMFRQGYINATPAQNKFIAGIHAMRNFYQDLDKSTIAARNQMELMPEAITSNAKAFEILTASIAQLTDQFRALAIAQAEAMGIPKVGGEAGFSPFNIPFRAPGFAQGIVGLPGSGNKDSIPAMLAPNESVMTSEATSKYGSILQAMNDGSIKGFVDGTIAAHTSMPFAPGSNQYESVMAKYPHLEQFRNSDPKVLKILSNLVNTDTTSKLNSLLNKPSGASRTEFESGFGVGKGAGFYTSAKLGGLQNINNSTMTALKEFEKAVKERTLSTTKGNILDQDLSNATKQIIAEFKKAGGASEEVAIALEKASQQVGQIRVNPGTSMIEQKIQSGLWGLKPGTQSIIQDVQSGGAVAERRKNLGYKDIQTFVPPSEFRSPLGDYSDAKNKLKLEANKIINELEQNLEVEIQKGSPSKRFADNIGAPITEGIGQGMVEAAPGLEASAQKVTTSLQEDLSSLWVPVEEDAAIAGKNTGNSFITGVEEEINSGSSQNRFAKLRSSFSNMGFAGRAGVGTALMMGGGMLGSSIGGTAGSSVNTGIMFGSMAAMTSLGPGAIAGITALGAAIPLLTAAFKKASDDLRVASNEVKSSYQITSQAVDYFGVKVQPLSQYDFASITAGLDKHVQSIKDNKAAVDKLTQAYLSASDQMTKDYIKGLKEKTGTDYESEIKKRYATDIASGMTTQQSFQDVTAIMNAVGTSSLIQNAIRAGLDTKLKTTEAFQQTIASTAPTGFKMPFGAPKGGMAQLQNRQNAENQRVAGLNAAVANLAGTNINTFSEIYKNLDKQTQSIINTDQAYNDFAKTISNGNKDLVKFTEDFRKHGGTTTQLAAAVRMLNDKVKDTNGNLITNDAILNSLTKHKFDKTFIDTLKQIIAYEGAVPGVNGTPPGSNNSLGTTDYSKQYAPLLKHLDSLIKLSQAATDAQKKYNDQLKLTQDYQNKQMDYLNQMKQAMTSGNFLGAAQMMDSAKAAQADYMSNMLQQQQADRTAALQNMRATVQEASTAGGSFASFAKENPNIARFATSKYDSAALGGLTANKLSAQTNNVLAQANNMQQQAMQAGANGPFSGNVVFNINASNSVIPQDWTKNSIDQWKKAIQTAYDKGAANGHNVQTKRR